MDKVYCFHSLCKIEFSKSWTTSFSVSLLKSGLFSGGETGIKFFA